MKVIFKAGYGKYRFTKEVEVPFNPWQGLTITDGPFRATIDRLTWNGKEFEAFSTERPAELDIRNAEYQQEWVTKLWDHKWGRAEVELQKVGDEDARRIFLEVGWELDQTACGRK